MPIEEIQTADVTASIGFNHLLEPNAQQQQHVARRRLSSFVEYACLMSRTRVFLHEYVFP